ncbi:putative phloem protein [Helianthus annuus]|uniref:Phloem protein n=1 Tax=Helianthus annuus TaxID=4232 RepID=A0A9K3NI57_HELAN|nr:putative phloem protein [Helianthus annuus]KAJ0559584.1 putative phloem protein [Helianthus annuus]KAJ0565609.1 putative phloem protein [Helianthus annuus]KAJ0572559.1 putative phloem protein [Helianthus annuus]KAJ0914325.1 putative phloem protein [Helianthus annuus]
MFIFNNHGHRHTLRHREAMDGWMEIKLGEFYNNNGDEGEIEMGFRSIMNIKEALWKVLRFGLSSVLIIDCE